MNKRIKSYTDAKTFALNLKNEDSRRSQARAKVEGQLSGNLPYNPTVLKSKGQGYRSNVNFRELEGIVKGRLGSFIRLLFDTPRLCNLKINDYSIPANYRMNWEIILAEEFHRLLRSQSSFFFAMARAMRNMVIHGLGTLYWPSEKSWLPKAAKPGKVYFSSNSDEDPDEYDVVAITDEISWDKLFALIETKEKIQASKNIGWNLDVVLTLINKLKTKESTDSLARCPETDEEFELLNAKRGSFTIEEGKPQSIEITHIYSKETSGKVTKSIVIANEEVEGEVTDVDDKYLYYKFEEFSAFDDVTITLLNEIGHDGIHSIRGFAHKVYPHAVAMNRMLNTAMDGAMVGSTILVQAPSGATKTMSDLLRLGPITVIDSDQKVVTGNLKSDISGVIQMRAVLQANMSNNFGAMRAASEGSTPMTSYKTARQTDVEMVRSNALTNIEVLTFYLFVDRAYKTMLKKMKSQKLDDKSRKAVSDFKDRCVKRGVPEEVMGDLDFDITAWRAVGSGSLEMLLSMSRDMLSIAPYLKEDGKRNVIRDFIIARVGAENAERYMPLMDTDQLDHFSHQIARFETNDMLLGQSAVVSPDDDHPYHLRMHFESTLGIINQFIKGEMQMPASQIVRFLAHSIEHISSHIAFIQGALNKPVIDQAMDTLQQIKVFHKKMQNQARKEQAGQERAYEEQQQILARAVEAVKGEDIQLKLEKIRMDGQINFMKAQRDLEIREMKTMHRMQMDEAESAAKVRSIERETLAMMNNY